MMTQCICSSDSFPLAYKRVQRPRNPKFPNASHGCRLVRSRYIQFLLLFSRIIEMLVTARANTNFKFTYRRFVGVVCFEVNIDEWRARTFASYVRLSFPMYQWSFRMEPL